jgi:hypothetical protein
MKKIIISLISLFVISPISSSYATEVYITIDENGNRIFSDTPSKESRKHKIKDITTIPAIKLPQAQAVEKSEKESSTVYQHLTILSPKADSSLTRDKLGSFTVSAQVSPGLEKEDEAVLLFDGQEISSGQSLNWQINDANRGSHSLQVIIRQKDNKLQKIASPSQNIYVKR